MADFYDNYSKKQLENLYWEAMCNEIKDSRFDRIKGALHETVHLGQYSKESFIDLLDTLFQLSDRALADIEKGNFRYFYKAYLTHTVGMPEDYYYMSLFLNGIYADYKNLKVLADYQYLSDECMLFMRDLGKLNDKRIMSAIMNYNPDLAQLLISHANTVNYKKGHEKKYNIDQMAAYTSIECSLLVSFLIGVDDYASDYSLPTRLLNEMVDKIPAEGIHKVGHYMKYNAGSPMLTKELLDRQYYKENIVLDIGEEDPKLS